MIQAEDLVEGQPRDMAMCIGCWIVRSTTSNTEVGCSISPPSWRVVPRSFSKAWGRCSKVCGRLLRELNVRLPVVGAWSRGLSHLSQLLLCLKPRRCGKKPFLVWALAIDFCLPSASDDIVGTWSGGRLGIWWGLIFREGRTDHCSHLALYESWMLLFVLGAYVASGPPSPIHSESLLMGPKADTRGNRGRSVERSSGRTEVAPKR
mmetsp:Transcript_37299/g.79189  ORF Transcript_37299/g.79189 Transcript_37299/m.79189 type:complete len:206 (+) Transcript_37299:85-702(+)